MPPTDDKLVCLAIVAIGVSAFFFFADLDDTSPAADLCLLTYRRMSAAERDDKGRMAADKNKKLVRMKIN